MDIKDEWKEKLTPEQYHVMREKGTEAPFQNKYWNTEDKGEYHCAACGILLFESEEKYDAGCGWPSFSDTPHKENIAVAEDTSHGMRRTEVLCKKCGGHLGHVFPDGPGPTGERYCINSAALNFTPIEEKKK